MPIFFLAKYLIFVLRIKFFFSTFDVLSCTVVVCMFFAIMRIFNQFCRDCLCATSQDILEFATYMYVQERVSLTALFMVEGVYNLL